MNPQIYCPFFKTKKIYDSFQKTINFVLPRGKLKLFFFFVSGIYGDFMFYFSSWRPELSSFFFEITFLEKKENVKEMTGI